MFDTICSHIPWDRDFPERTRRLEIFRRVFDGTLYDYLPYEFQEERNASGEYIPLRKRRPSVRYALARIVVEDSVALLFSEGHFPSIESNDPLVRTAANTLADSSCLNAIMIDAALRGSIGSVAILMRVLNGRIFLDTLDTLYLTPEWDANAPDMLSSVTERYKVAGSELLARGYEVTDPNANYWFVRQWDRYWELWFEPVPIGAPLSLRQDDARCVHHGLGFVPLVWIKNLPGGPGVDGSCTFRSAIDTSIEIDYQLSQAGRGLKYSSDPTLIIKEPTGLDPTLVRGAANSLVLSEKGDAKLLEIGGTASEAVIQYVRVLREYALESVHGNRVDASRLATPSSGRALELMNQGLLWLADNLRISYGQLGLLPVLRMMLQAASIYPLSIFGGRLAALSGTAALSLRWPDWYPPDALDRQRDAAALIALVKARQLSRETALRILASNYDIQDVTGELGRLAAESLE